ncbi:HNH endonuclease [Mycolicibacterium fluoranthenivorans]|uniref:HNH endonuclease n=1 Tax=Mycolicibacterium fluoranthenivorans TaxID=258505 RepID=A0A7G8P9H1_9MYCO|nr:HNH endonuclease [Mycolicibacterium fluoranthenivorans]QNJ90987.1 HNH endonuclease [Mycolicibacterium fluoranthenivorans]
MARSWLYGFLPVVGTVTTRLLIARYGNHCYYCPDGAFECIDHRVCVRAGGTHTMENIVPACNRCNKEKYWLIDKPLIRRLDEKLAASATV